MKPAGKRALKIIAVALAVLAALTALAPTLLSTGPGRHVAEALAAARLHRTVQVERLDLGWTTGIYIEKLTVAGGDGSGVASSLAAATLRCSNTLLTLVWFGRTPFQLAGVQFTYINQQQSTEVQLTDCAVTGSYEAGLFTVAGTGRLNEGDLVFSGHLDRRESPAPFDLKAALKNAKASNRTSALGYQAPILYNPTGLTTGTLDLEVALQGRGFGRADLAANLVGESHLRVRDLRLEKSKLLARLAKFLPFVKPDETLELGNLNSDSTIAGGRITSPDVELVRQGDRLLILSGWSDFTTGEINYAITSKSKKLEKVESLAALVDLRLMGTLKDPKVELGLAGQDTTIDVKQMIDLFKKKKKAEPPAP
jgi:hypothetical protein